MHTSEILQTKQPILVQENAIVVFFLSELKNSLNTYVGSPYCRTEM